ncbi:TetR/AcrR family transcriptional regulator [Streptomyces sp. Pv4-95]|uniref:TetR/AcrR family transcriptional regulator n=1 Tax=Streptomyces sp. Pv4-95 TaxID=3049543 RepID=UPI0038927C36
MARPRMFDEKRALEGAMRLFWEKGYEASSTQELCEATGLGRSSIYNTFSSKHALFLRALTNYLDTTTVRQSEILGDTARPPAERVRDLLSSVIDIEESNRRDGLGIGCLGVNSTSEMAGHDREVAGLLRRDRERRRSDLSAVIAEGQRAGEFSRARSADDYASFLNAAIAGMRISAQGGADRAALEAIAGTALDSLIH